MAVTKKQRQFIFEKYGGRCAYCGCDLEKGWHVDHLRPVKRYTPYDKETKKYLPLSFLRPENDTVENYNPSCPSCNMQKKDWTLEQFRQNIKNYVSSLNKYSVQYKFARRYGLVEETQIEVKFYFETLENGNS